MLSTGTRLGPYEILSALGAGGMGEVYRARDIRLERTVAIKVLPAHVAEHAELRQRLEREAKAISSLSHANVCTLYDIGHQSGIDYLVMEYLEGETLADRLTKGPLPTDQILHYGIEIAEGLEIAHRSGIIHRDLKPSNIMLTRSGVKLMDFGLAKSRAAAAASSLSATLMEANGSSQPLTAEGTVVGTFQYMSPEQVEGKEADARSDLFALGAVLYEMATGKRAFSGKSQASVAAAVLAFEPAPISSLQPMTPPSLEFLIKTCLTKEPDIRFQSAHDVKLQLLSIQECASKPGDVVLPRERHRSWRVAAVGALVSLLLLAAGVATYTRWFVRAPRVQAYIPAPEKTAFNLDDDDGSGPAVVSPDASHIAFVVSDTHGKHQVWVRALADPTARALPGTDGASYPFWSPGGKSIGFFAEGKLKRITVSGGPALDICSVTRPRGGSWSPDGNIILFSPDTTAGIFRVPVRPGSTPVAVTRLDPAYHTTHRWPYFLPDGKHFLYLASSHVNPGPTERNGTYWASLDGKENQFLMPTDSNAVYASGYLLFVQNGSLVAQPFIPESGRLSGDPAVVAEDVFRNSGTWRAAFDASPNGVLAFHPGSSVLGSQLQWFTLNGTVLGKVGERDRYIDLRLSHDNHKLAVTLGDPLADIWIFDLDRGTRMRFTFGTGNTSAPVWSPDGKYLLFGLRHHAGALDLYRKFLVGAAEPEPVLASDAVKHADDISPDGRFLLFEQKRGDVLNTLWVMPLFGDKKPYPLLAKAVTAYQAQFSPDGKWVVYNSSESGPMEIYITSFVHGGKWQLTTDGGWAPKWRADGKAIYYYGRTDGSVREVPVVLKGDDVEIGTYRPLFRAINAGYTFWERPFDVSSDGKRFLVNTVELEESKPISLILNWKTLIAK